MNQEDMQIIGTLALEKDTKRKGVFINTKSAIQYVVKSMMSDYKSDKLFTGYMNSFENDQKFDDEYRSDEERVEKFWDHIYDKLFIYNFKANDGEFERMTKVHLVNKPVKFNEDEYFKGVPVFSAATDEIVREWELESQWSLYRNYNTLDEFCDCIKAKQPLGSTYGYDATESQPSFVIWKNQNQKLYVIGKIANCRYNSQRGLILEKEGQELLKIDISDQAEKIVYDVDANPTLAFVPETIYKQIEDQILKAEVERTKKYDSQYAGQLYNSATYPSKIIIGDNIRFIGTVNIDESTYHFSDKVLDRANVIELDVLDYSKEWTKKQYASLITPTWSKDEYDALINKDVDIKADKVQELLWEIHQLLQSASAKYGVGPRIVKAIKMYINNLPKTEINGFNKGVALDYQIAQRILTKVRGPEIQIGRLLNGKSNTGFNQIFDKYSELSDFKKCRKVISEKQKELGAYGYCI